MHCTSLFVVCVAVAHIRPVSSDFCTNFGFIQTLATGRGNLDFCEAPQTSIRTPGTFRLKGMSVAEPWLDCQQIRQRVVIERELIGAGAVKQIFLGSLLPQRLPVAVARPTIHDDGTTFLDDFRHGILMLTKLSPHPRLIQLVGICPGPHFNHLHHTSSSIKDDDIMLVTEYHRRGSADTLEQHLLAEPKFNTIEMRFRLCLDYAEILVMLHSTERRVMCDSSTLHATLKQYLLRDDLRLLLNDVDALPAVTSSADGGGGVRCGQRPLYGEFVAPEQRSGERGELPDLYDEKTDVWKMPAVCEYFLSVGEVGVDAVAPLMFRLFAIHRRCRMHLAADRPTTAEVLDVYRNVWRELFG